MRSCHTYGCGAPPAFRFTWPGKDEAWACVICAMQGKAVADALGCHVQYIPLGLDDYLNDKAKEPQP